jgi:hypothetical protein
MMAVPQFKQMSTLTLSPPPGERKLRTSNKNHFTVKQSQILEILQFGLIFISPSPYPLPPGERKVRRRPFLITLALKAQ